ncbi:MAG: hypothetical protein AAFQ98_24435 [Bacteroidota bacterium]
MKYLTQLLLILLMPGVAFGQEPDPEMDSLMLELEALEAELKPFTDKFFGTFFEVGYLMEQSEMLEGGILLKYAVEYRQSPANNLLIRFNLDQYGLNYNVATDLGPINTLSGETSITDALIGVGYRLGEDTFRFFGLAQAGWKFYSFPSLDTSNPNRLLEAPRDMGIYRFTAGVEYYFDDTFAATIDVFHQRVFEATDFWVDQQGATCISVGLVGSFF